MEFKEQKKQDLDKADKSRKGTIDSHIVELIEQINALDDYYTTSSCSGRIQLMSKPSHKKHEAEWLYVTHDESTLKEVSIGANKPFVGELWFRQEQFILHVRAQSIEAAFTLIECAQKAGFKHSGINGKRRLIVEITSSEKLDTIIGIDGKLMISPEYLELLVRVANEKQRNNWRRIKAFQENIAHIPQGEKRKEKKLLLQKKHNHCNNSNKDKHKNHS